MVRQLLNMADADYTVLTPLDKETLLDVMNYGGIDYVARLRHATPNACSYEDGALVHSTGRIPIIQYKLIITCL